MCDSALKSQSRNERITTSTLLRMQASALGSFFCIPHICTVGYCLHSIHHSWWLLYRPKMWLSAHLNLRWPSQSLGTSLGEIAWQSACRTFLYHREKPCWGRWALGTGFSRGSGLMDPCKHSRDQKSLDDDSWGHKKRALTSFLRIGFCSALYARWFEARKLQGGDQQQGRPCWAQDGPSCRAWQYRNVPFCDHFRIPSGKPHVLFCSKFASC